MTYASIQPPPPRPMPEIREAQIYIPDAIAALVRAKGAWNREQLEDAIHSTNNFIALAEKALKGKP